MKDYCYIILIICFFFLIFNFNKKENFLNTNNDITQYYDKMNNITVPVTPIMYDTDQCSFTSGENLYKNNNDSKIKYNIIKENKIENTKVCDYSSSNIKNPYDFRIHRSNNSKGLYSNSVTFGSQ